MSHASKPAQESEGAKHKTIGLRLEVFAALEEVESLCKEKFNITPTHSEAFMNALQLYKDQLQAA